MITAHIVLAMSRSPDSEGEDQPPHPLAAVAIFLALLVGQLLFAVGVTRCISRMTERRDNSFAGNGQNYDHNGRLARFRQRVEQMYSQVSGGANLHPSSTHGYYVPLRSDTDEPDRGPINIARGQPVAGLPGPSAPAFHAAPVNLV